MWKEQVPNRSSCLIHLMKTKDGAREGCIFFDEVHAYEKIRLLILNEVD